MEQSIADNSRLKSMVEGLVPLSTHQVVDAYKGWAPIYDWTFGMIARAGRNAAVERVNRIGGRLLEVGVGTGLTLSQYGPRVKVVGMDLSPHMLEQAQERVARDHLDNVVGLSLMDAGSMAFADNSFDVVTAMYVMTVAPDPQAVFAELCRVVRPGGEIILVNHFSHEEGWRGRIEKMFAPHAARLGWRPEFPLAPFVDAPGLTLTNSRELAPLGLFTMLSFRKDDVSAIDSENSATLAAGRLCAADLAEGIGRAVPAANREVGGFVSAMSGEGA